MLKQSVNDPQGNAVLNGLNQARFGSLPKPLRSEEPYRVRLRVIP